MCLGFSEPHLPSNLPLHRFQLKQKRAQSLEQWSKWLWEEYPYLDLRFVLTRRYLPQGYTESLPCAQASKYYCLRCEVERTVLVFNCWSFPLFSSQTWRHYGSVRPQDHSLGYSNLSKPESRTIPKADLLWPNHYYSSSVMLPSCGKWKFEYWLSSLVVCCTPSMNTSHACFCLVKEWYLSFEMDQYLQYHSRSPFLCKFNNLLDL